MPDDPENHSPDTGDPTPELSPQVHSAPSAPREIWTLRDLLLFVVFIPFAYLVSDLLALVGYVMVRPFVGWRESAELAQKSTFFLLAMQCLFYIFVLGFLFVVSRLRHGQPFWRSMGWRRPSWNQVAVWLSCGGGLAVLAGLALAIRPDTRSFPLEGMFTSRAACFAIGAFAVSIAPVIEEVVFRGLLFAICERKVGLPFAVTATAVLFAVLHIPEYWPAWNHILVIFVVGMVFSLARGVSGALTPSIFLHVGYNALMITGFFFSTQYFGNLNTFLNSR